jgi:hypothetical protein
MLQMFRRAHVTELLGNLSTTILRSQSNIQGFRLHSNVLRHDYRLSRCRQYVLASPFMTEPLLRRDVTLQG